MEIGRREQEKNKMCQLKCYWDLFCFVLLLFQGRGEGVSGSSTVMSAFFVFTPA